MASFEPTRPYNDLPRLPPAAEIQSQSILKKCIAARAALAELKGVGRLIPNQAVLINTIPLREAKDSSAIENIVTTDDKLFHHAALPNDQADPHTKETLRYRTALFDGFQSLQERPLTTATAVHVCQVLRGVAVDVRKVPGTALRNVSTGDIKYTPPEGEQLLRDMLSNWEAFLHNATDVDPVIRMAVGHYQFEAIHPFTDGNGRTGRILNILFLISQGLLDIPVLYLSRYIIERRRDYYRLLYEVTASSRWEDWILYMLEAVEQTAVWTTAKLLAIKRLIEHTRNYIVSRRPSADRQGLIDIIFTQPYCRIGHLVSANLGNRKAASKYLRELCDLGVLTERKDGREKIFVHPKLMRLLMDDGHDFRPY